MKNSQANHDQLELLGPSQILHGPTSQRIYLLRLKGPLTEEHSQKLNHLAQKNHYSKIIAKASRKQKESFLRQGYLQEAHIPNSNPDRSGIYFLSKFLNQERATPPNPQKVEEVLQLAREKALNQTQPYQLPQNSSLERCQPQDSSEMAEIYRKVFATYPFPVSDPDYLQKTMTENYEYFCIKEEETIVALASCEKYEDKGIVEMTDFATLPQARGKQYAQILLKQMEHSMSEQEFSTAYTMARSNSPGMNITFARSGYHHTGTLTKNTEIAGSLESMNVWYKHLDG